MISLRSNAACRFSLSLFLLMASDSGFPSIIVVLDILLQK